MATENNVLKDTLETLHDFARHATEEGRLIEGDTSTFLSLTAERIGHFADTIRTDATLVVNSDLVHRLADLGNAMYVQVEHNEVLKSFWHGMVEEIPDLIEWIQNALEKSGEAVVQAAETAGETITQTAETAGEAITQAAESAGEAAMQFAEVAAETAIQAADAMPEVAAQAGEVITEVATKI